MVKNAVTTTYAYNNDNQLITELTNGITITYAYDDNGNLVSKTDGVNTTTYAWDWNNRLVSVTEPGEIVTNYAYNGEGTRISKTEAGVKTYYVTDVTSAVSQVIMEKDNLTTARAIYTYGNDLISMHRADANSYYHYDGLGSTRQLTDDAGSVTVGYIYDAFGNAIYTSGSSVNAYGFTGEQQLNEADNMVYLRARYYSPSVGRFMSRDPILSPIQIGSYVGWLVPYFLSRPQSLHPYVYVQNNPIILIDPTGKFVWKGIACAACGICLGSVGLSCAILCIEDPSWDCPGEGFAKCFMKCGKSLPGASPPVFIGCSAACIACNPKLKLPM